MDLMVLKIQLDVYIMKVGSDNKFSKLKRIDKLRRKIIDTKKDKLYSLVYLLILLVVITSVKKKKINYEFCEKSNVKSNN